MSTLDVLKSFSRDVLRVENPIDEEAPSASQNNGNEPKANNGRQQGKGEVRININPEEYENQPQPNTKEYWIEFCFKNFVVILSCVAALMGVFNCFTFSPWCLMAGILLTFTGAMIVAFEAPNLVSSFGFMEPIRQLGEARRPIEKVIIYMVPALLVLILCLGLFTFIGFFAISCVSAMYVFAYIV